MIGSFGRKHKSHGKNYGKKDSSKFKRGLIAGGAVLALGAGLLAGAGDKETHAEVEYPTIASEEGGGLGHTKELVERQKEQGVSVGETEAPPPAITPENISEALQPDPDRFKTRFKVGEGLKLAGEVATGETGKVKAVKKGIDIARGNSESQSTKSLEEQIKQAEKAAKNRSTKISRETANVRPTIGPVAPPEFFQDTSAEDEETKKNKKQRAAAFFAKPFKRS